MDTRRSLPRNPKIRNPKSEIQYTPWEPLSKTLDHLEDQGLLFLFADKEVTAREVLVDFLRWCLADGVQIGLDSKTGQLLIRAPYKD